MGITAVEHAQVAPRNPVAGCVVDDRYIVTMAYNSSSSGGTGFTDYAVFDAVTETSGRRTSPTMCSALPGAGTFRRSGCRARPTTASASMCRAAAPPPYASASTRRTRQPGYQGPRCSTPRWGYSDDRRRKGVLRRPVRTQQFCHHSPTCSSDDGFFVWGCNRAGGSGQGWLSG